MKTPAAYLRRSYVDPESPGDISREAQRAAVRELAAADGHNGNLQEYDDWGVSADVAKAGQRTAYARLLGDMEAGKVAAVYAFDVDRLYRDPRDLIRLQDAAQRHAVRIVTTGGPLAIGDGDDPAAEGFAFMGAVFGRMELQKAKKRARAAREARIARGDRFGHPPYGYQHVRDASGRIVRVRDDAVDLEPIVQAYLEAGTILGTARLLNARGVPAPKGGAWHTFTVQNTIERNWPELLPAKGASGKRIRATSVLSQLVKCHCGHVMTPNTHRRQLYCSHAMVTQEHGRYTVQEAPLVEWMTAEAGRLRIPFEAVETSTDSDGRRLALEAQRDRLGIALVDGLLSHDAAKAKAAEIDQELAALDAQEHVAAVPPIDWSWPAPQLNAALRALWAYVELDEQMQPVRAEWRVPEWRQT